MTDIISKIDEIKRMLEDKLQRLRISANQIEVTQGLSDITKRLGLFQSGELRFGNSVEPGKGFTGIRIGFPTFTYDSVEFNLAVVVSDALVGGISSGGVIYLGGVTNGLSITSGGVVALNGSATVFDDLTAQLIGLRLESPSSHIVTNAAEGTLEFKTSCNLTDYVIAEPQLSHKWKLGSVIYPHLHWEQTSATIPNWLIQYRWQKQGLAKTTSWTSQKYDAHVFTYTSGTLNQITSMGDITPPVGYGLSDFVDFRILRDVANTSGLFAGADGLATSVYAKGFDFHMETDSLGSNDEFTK